MSLIGLHPDSFGLSYDIVGWKIMIQKPKIIKCSMRRREKDEEEEYDWNNRCYILHNL